MERTKVRPWGNSLGTTIPKNILEQAKVAEGDEMFVRTNDQGEIVLSPYNPEFEEAMEIYREERRRYKNAMKELSNR